MRAGLEWWYSIYREVRVGLGRWDPIYLRGEGGARMVGSDTLEMGRRGWDGVIIST